MHAALIGSPKMVSTILGVMREATDVPEVSRREKR